MKDIEVFFVGRTNAGKSTVIKELFGLKTRTGRNPGVTRAPVRHRLGNLIVIDLPGIGFRRGRYGYRSMLRTIIESSRDRHQPLPLGVQIIDAKSFLEIIERHSKPFDVDLFDDLLDFEIDPIVAINKMDKIESHEASLNEIVSRLGMLPPYKQWIDRVVPISAKKHDVAELRWLISYRLQRLRETGENTTA
ncbi:MAG: GTP-binding protein EngB [Euryarchaeota archaeon]|jgi:GTP-binding protein EngB required for normal cell division